MDQRRASDHATSESENWDFEYTPTPFAASFGPPPRAAGKRPLSARDDDEGVGDTTSPSPSLPAAKRREQSPHDTASHGHEAGPPPPDLARGHQHDLHEQQQQQRQAASVPNPAAGDPALSTASRPAAMPDAGANITSGSVAYLAADSPAPGLPHGVVDPGMGLSDDAEQALKAAADAVKLLDRLSSDLDNQEAWQDTVNVVLDGMRAVQRRWQQLEGERRLLAKARNHHEPGQGVPRGRGRGRGRGKGRGRGRGRWRTNF